MTVQPRGDGPRDGTAENGKPYESVWDFPRPPALQLVPWRIRVMHREATIVDAPQAYRILETSQPPAYYVAPEFVDTALLEPTALSTYCEWKGQASYVDVVVDGVRLADAGWHYPVPNQPFAAIVDHYAFYAQKLDRCFVDDEEVAPNDGSFYGGWITANVTGPFKGAPGTLHW